jgi:hypothetical protein
VRTGATKSLIISAGSNGRPAGPVQPPPVAWQLLLGVAAATVALLLIVASRYGYHRDELYFLEASRHMAWGYVDQPPLSVAFVWLSRMLFGDSLEGLRLFPALAMGAAVVVTGLMTRELGGGRFAQSLASLSLAMCPFLIAGHFAGPTVYDLVFWALALWLVIRILRTGATRLWLLVGLVVGVGLLNKETMLFLLFGLAAGLIVNRQWRTFASPWVWAGLAVAVLIWSPVLIWEARHGWPTLEMWGSLRREHSGAGASLTYPFIEIILPGVWALAVWAAGFWALLSEARWRAYRCLAIAFLVLLVLFWIFVGDRPYYVGPLFTVLLAAGSVVAAAVVEGARRFFSTKAPRRRLVWRSQRAALSFVIVFAAILLPLSLPVLPPRVLATVPLQKLNYNLGEEIGWPDFVDTVARAYFSLPPAERRTTVIVTGNYGEAGAIDRYGPALGLPQPYSGHNNYWWWGPPQPSLGTAVFVGYWSKPYLETMFRSATLVAHIHNPYGVSNDEWGAEVWICRGQIRPWPALWPQFKDYG